ncbi:8630_t:CDS:2, partial [Paraglomus occultum]
EREISDRESLSEETIGPESLASNQSTQIYFTQAMARMRKGIFLDPEKVVLKTPEQRKTSVERYLNYKDRKETQELIDELEKELEIISRIENSLSKHSGQEKELIAQTKQTENTQTQERFSIKNFLLENSYLVQFKEKEASGKSLSKAEKAKQERIYDLRDKVFSNIKKELVKYITKQQLKIKRTTFEPQPNKKAMYRIDRNNFFVKPKNSTVYTPKEVSIEVESEEVEVVETSTQQIPETEGTGEISENVSDNREIAETGRSISEEEISYLNYLESQIDTLKISAIENENTRNRLTNLLRVNEQD